MSQPIRQADAFRDQADNERRLRQVEVRLQIGVIQESWHLIAGTGEPAFQNSWVNFGATRVARFKKFIDGRVRLTGVIKTGTIGTSAFVLPVDYRPTSQMIYAVVSNSLFGAVTINTDGSVVPSVGSNISFFLDGVEFDTK